MKNLFKRLKEIKHDAENRISDVQIDSIACRYFTRSITNGMLAKITRYKVYAMIGKVICGISLAGFLALLIGTVTESIIIGLIIGIIVSAIITTIASIYFDEYLATVIENEYRALDERSARMAYLCPTAWSEKR